MDDRKSEPKSGSGTSDPREARLKAALRENLKRRKAQAKARTRGPVPGTADRGAPAKADAPDTAETPESTGFAANRPTG